MRILEVTLGIGAALLVVAIATVWKQNKTIMELRANQEQHTEFIPMANIPRGWSFDITPLDSVDSQHVVVVDSYLEREYMLIGNNEEEIGPISEEGLIKVLQEYGIALPR
jgi:hypothetical protein